VLTDTREIKARLRGTTNSHYGHRNSQWCGGKYMVCNTCGKPLGYRGPNEQRARSGNCPACAMKVFNKTKRKYSDDEIRDIRRRYANGESLRTLVKNLNASKSAISYILNRKTYKDVT
jgi:DNA-directed RNA polymerase subunit RPC12/RpoP